MIEFISARQLHAIVRSLRRAYICSLLSPPLLEKLECELRDMAMHCCAVNRFIVATDIHNCLSMGAAFRQKSVVSYFSGKNH